jgi:hypothetical protein
MRFDILSNRSAAEQAIRDDLLKKKYAIKSEEAKAATMRAQASGVTALTGAKTAERQFGPKGLAEQKLERRHPMGLPEKQAETARISATGYAGAATRGATTAEKRLGLEREQFEYSKSFLETEGGLPGSEAAHEKEVAKIKGKLESSYNPCPEGFTWDGQQCVPSI